MEGEGGGQLQLQRFEKSLVKVEKILDENRVLIKEINENHESKTPHHLSRNVGLIRELNNNIRKVVDLYSDLSFHFSRSKSISMDVNSSEADSRSDAKALHKRTRQ